MYQHKPREKRQCKLSLRADAFDLVRIWAFSFIQSTTVLEFDRAESGSFMLRVLGYMVASSKEQQATANREIMVAPLDVVV